MFKRLLQVLGSDFELPGKDEARSFFNRMRQKFIDWNYTVRTSEEFKQKERDIDGLYIAMSGKLNAQAADLLKDGE